MFLLLLIGCFLSLDADLIFIGETNEGAGYNKGEWAGWRIDGGDLTGDGKTDLLITARFNDTLAADAGKVYLIPNKDMHSGKNLLGSFKTSFLGEGDDDHFGRDLAAADANGDRIADLLTSAYTDKNGHDSGAAYLFLSSNIIWNEPRNASSADHIFSGHTDDQVGRSVDFMNDIDGNFRSEVVVGAPGYDYKNDGAAAIFTGFQKKELFLEEADYFLMGSNGENAGISVGNAGDTDGDGKGDLLVGAWIADYLAFNNSGVTYLVRGNALTSQKHILKNDFPFFYGVEHTQSSGRTVIGAKDLNQDGYDDILIGAHGPDTSPTSKGTTYLILSKPDLDTIPLNQADYIFVGEDSGDRSGDSLAAGDLDGDSIPEIVIGGSFNKTNGIQSGRAYVFLGNGLEPGKYSLADANYIRTGKEYNWTGCNVAIPGDINIDGKADLMISSQAWDSNRGKVEVFFDVEDITK